MPFITDQQLEERAALEDAIRTVTKVEPRRFAQKIYEYIVTLKYEKDLDNNTILERLEHYMANLDVNASADGNRVDGWKMRYVRLSVKQQMKIHAWISFALKLGATFSPYAEDK